jgi:glycosyltransferase involved in cell wall biosynthesis
VTKPVKVRRPTVWVNVTTSANWTRPAVGIVRVERELSRELSKLYADHEYGLCVYRNGEFVPYDADELPSATSAPSHTTATSVSAPRFPRSSTFESIFGWMRAPTRRQKSVAPVAASMPQAEPRTHTQTGTSPERRIRYGDIIVSVGLDWDHPYTNDFQKLRDERGIHIVTCCYDLIPVLFPQYCVGSVASQFKDYFTKLSWASSLILCISERSRTDYQDLMKMIGAPEAETLVMPLGDHVPDSAKATTSKGTADLREDISPDVARATEQPFILFVSTIERRKNHEVLYRAYHLLARAEHADRLPKLVFVGMPGWGVGDLLKDIEFDPLTQGLITQLNHVSDRELSWLYEKAYFCVFPSLYEGWGLPIGEALACGKAVIASGEGSIPEVGGDLVTYLDPWNPKAWAEEILALVDDPGRIKAMEAAVRERYTPRTWRDTAVAVKAGLDKLREVQPVSVVLEPGHHLSTKVGIAWGGDIRSTGAAGQLTRGPRRALPPGRYDIQVYLRPFDGQSGEVLFAFRSANGKRDHASLKVRLDGSEGPEQIHSFPLTLDDHVEDYELFTEVPAGAHLSLNRIEIREIQVNLSTDVPTTEG